MNPRISYLAAGWAFASGALALAWTVTDRGYPYGERNIDDALHPLRDLPASVGAPLFAAVLLAAGVLALAVAGRHPMAVPRAPRLLLLGYGWAVAGALLVVVPGTEVLTFAGYAPMLLIGAPFGWPDVNYAEVFDGPLLFGLWSVLGGLLLGRAMLTWQRRSASACVACGRSGTGAVARWATPAAAARWGRWAAYVAAAVPASYAVTRLAWLFGIPLGVSRSFLDELGSSGAVWAGAGLGTFALVGSVLTLGLVQRWGERFPRWMVGLAGRRVPVKLATVPASVVAVAVGSASVGFLSSGEALGMIGSGSSAVLPMVLWPVWSVALAAATLAYHLRRRGSCATCGRGDLAPAGGGARPLAAVTP